MIWAAVLFGFLILLPNGPAAVQHFAAGQFNLYRQSSGDTWITAWADDDQVYSVSDDTAGFGLRGIKRNFMVHRLSGDDPRHLAPVTVNTMDVYGKETQPMSELGLGPAAGHDGRTWKADGMTCIDGVLYVFISKHDYPWRNKSLTDQRQTAADASIIKSADHGRTWTRSARQNYMSPMFPGRHFGAPFFITYGKDGKAGPDGSDTYVYALSNNGYWNNGDALYLGRVRRDLLPRLRGDDWQFYHGGDGIKSSAWTSDVSQAKPVLSDPGQISMSAVQYLPQLGMYLLSQWHYPPNTFGGRSIWNFRVSKTPWGPWSPLNDQPFANGYYNPAVMMKFASADDRHLVVSTSGDFRGKQLLYKFTVADVDLMP